MKLLTIYTLQFLFPFKLFVYLILINTVLIQLCPGHYLTIHSSMFDFQVSDLP